MDNILPKLDNTQTKDRIAKILRQEIISGRFKNGEQLTQEQIAQYLNTSRIPVREAFLILELEGFLSRLPNRHVLVVGPKIDLLKEIFELIASVEIQIIKILLNSKKDIRNILVADAKQFRQVLLTEIDNYFIKENYSRLLVGYPQYVWDNIEKKSSDEDLHNSLIASIQTHELKAIAKFVYKYYFSLADSLTKKLNRS
ncbi:GntR family transcriptional regulator [Gilliamella apicola]|uniref:GntR family transcriptional regulator n=1 Tax=Gilliamella apicola TaxID=1196095 RepID=UPI002FEE160E